MYFENFQGSLDDGINAESEKGVLRNEVKKHPKTPISYIYIYTLTLISIYIRNLSEIVQTNILTNIQTNVPIGSGKFPKIKDFVFFEKEKRKYEHP